MIAFLCCEISCLICFYMYRKSEYISFTIHCFMHWVIAVNKNYQKKKNCFLQKCCILMEGVRNITNINEKVCQTSLRGMYFGSCAVTILKKVVGRATLRGDIWAYSWKMRMPTMQVQSALISTGSTSVIQSTADKKYLRKKLCCCWYVLCNWLMVVTTLVNTHKHLSCYHSLNNTV